MPKGRISRARRQQISEQAHRIAALARARGSTVSDTQEELLREFPGELAVGEARMFAQGWTVRVVREGVQALAAEEGLNSSGLQDADVWRWLRGEVFPRDSLERLCKLFRCHQAQLGWPPRGRDVTIDFTDGAIDLANRDRARADSTDLASPAPSSPSLWTPGRAVDLDGGIWDMKRRDFVRAGGLGLLLATLPGGPHLSQLGEWLQPNHGPKPPSLDTLERYQNLLDECWVLCNAGETNTAEQVVRGLLPSVAPHAASQAGAGVVMARGLLLIGVVSHHRLRVQDKVSFCQQAVEYARESGDATALVSALVELAVAFRYAGQPANAIAAHVEALNHVERAAPLVASRAYASAAAAFAQDSRIPEAARYVQRAYEAFPADPQADPHWMGDTGIWYLSFHEGRALAAAGRTADAETAFERYKAHTTAAAAPERLRLEIVNERGRAAVAGGDLDLYASCLRSGLDGALALGSSKRYQEAVSIYREEAPADWRRQPLISHIAEEFRLDAAAAGG